MVHNIKLPSRPAEFHIHAPSFSQILRAPSRTHIQTKAGATKWPSIIRKSQRRRRRAKLKNFLDYTCVAACQLAANESEAPKQTEIICSWQCHVVLLQLPSLCVRMSIVVDVSDIRDEHKSNRIDRNILARQHQRHPYGLSLIKYILNRNMF